MNLDQNGDHWDLPLLRQTSRNHLSNQTLKTRSKFNVGMEKEKSWTETTEVVNQDHHPSIVDVANDQGVVHIPVPRHEVVLIREAEVEAVHREYGETRVIVGTDEVKSGVVEPQSDFSVGLIGVDEDLTYRHEAEPGEMGLAEADSEIGSVVACQDPDLGQGPTPDLDGVIPEAGPGLLTDAGIFETLLIARYCTQIHILL